jgi:apolipoprotein D and lipocalin family protein
MKTLFIALLVMLNTTANIPNKPVEKVDVKKFAGKWYSLYSIPTMFDKGTRETTAYYNLNKDGYYNVLTTAKKDDDNEIHTYNSKLFPETDGNAAEMKAQFVWPIKISYWVIDIAPDYSYVVVGHPDHKFLFIMSRKPSMDKETYTQIIEKCKAMGYPVNELTCQMHKG